MNAKIFFRKHGSRILTGLGIVGFVATVVTAVKATPKAVEIIKEKENEKQAPLTTFEKAKCAAHCYIPAALTGTATVVCIVGANITNLKIAASLSSGCALIVDQFNRYRNSAKDIYGEEGHRAIVEHMETVDREETYPYSSGGIVAHGFDLPENSEQYLFFDTISEVFFTATYEEVLQALYHLNRNFAGRGYLPLNEYYEFLGIECDSMLGWSVYDFEIPSLDVSIWKGTKCGKPCYILEPLFMPSAAYMEDWL